VENKENKKKSEIKCKIDDIEIMIEYSSFSDIFENLKHSTNEEFNKLLNSKNNNYITNINDLNENDIFIPFKSTIINIIFFNKEEEKKEQIKHEIIKENINELKNILTQKFKKNISIIASIDNDSNNKKIISKIEELENNFIYFAFENLGDLKKFDLNEIKKEKDNNESNLDMDILHNMNLIDNDNEKIEINKRKRHIHVEINKNENN
jgi:hypothetical protein